MTLTLPDDPALKGLTEAEIRLDLACALYSSGRLSRTVAARLAGLERGQFDEELFHRHIPAYTAEMLHEDVATLDKLFSR